MNSQKSKITTVLLAALLIISIGASIFAATASAATTRSTYAYVTAKPDTVGVGERITIYAWVNQIFPSAAMTNDYRFHNFTVVITKPDNHTETMVANTIQDTTSNQAFSYTPNATGTYKVDFYFPETFVNATSHAAGATADDVYKASSASCTFTVQEDSIGYPPDSYPLPTEYWTRPIYGENSFWYTISSNWLGFGSPNYLWNSPSAFGVQMGGNGQQYPSDAVGSLTSHIMWTKPLQSGGVVGGNTGTIPGNTYFDGSAYYVRYENPIIVSGKLIYTEPLSYTSKNAGDTVCVDLRTGEELWRNPTMGALSFAIVADFENGNQHGQYNALLIAVSSTTWRFYDADTGRALFNATGVPTSGTKVMGPNNEFLYYTVTNQTQGWQLAQWNSSKLWSVGGTGPTANLNNVVAANQGNKYDWNTSITYNGANFTTAQSFRVLAAYYGDYMLCMNGTFPSTGTNMFFGTTETYAPYTYFLVNLNATKGTVGAIEWINTITPATQTTVVYSGVDTVNEVFVEGDREQLYWRGYSIKDGSLLWSTKDYPQTAMDYYGSQASGSLTNSFYAGKLYSAAYGGLVYCYNTSNGALLWTYGNGGAGNSTDSGFGVPGNYPTFVSGFGQGVVYTLTSEHTIQTPIYKGAVARCLNATTGAEIWTLSDYTNEFSQGAFAMADGFNTWFNGYDNQIYVVGRGPSQTTISAPQTQITAGNKVVIQGTVIDLSAGTQQNQQAAAFPAGVPVSSDASMKDWMAYVYQQKPQPTNFTGVTVTVMAVDPNHNYVTLGTATTDVNGVYHLTWTAPAIPGDYTIYALFAGNNGYWGSKAVTNMVVTEAPATVAPTETPQSAADLYFIPAIVGVIIAIVVVGAVLALLVSKKP